MNHLNKKNKTKKIYSNDPFKKIVEKQTVNTKNILRRSFTVKDKNIVL